MRDWFESSEHHDASQSRLLIGNILDTGLEPTKPPSPLPPIDKEEIELLRWMGIDCDSGSGFLGHTWT